MKFCSNQQSSIVNEMGGGADISLRSEKKPGIRADFREM
jgi:hypothetical protein